MISINNKIQNINLYWGIDAFIRHFIITRYHTLVTMNRNCKEKLSIDLYEMFK